MLLRKIAFKSFLAFASTTLHHIHFLLAPIFTFTSWLRMQSSICLSRFNLKGRFLTTYGNTILLCSRFSTNVPRFFFYTLVPVCCFCFPSCCSLYHYLVFNDFSSFHLLAPSGPPENFEVKPLRGKGTAVIATWDQPEEPNGRIRGTNMYGNVFNLNTCMRKHWSVPPEQKTCWQCPKYSIRKKWLD